MSDGLSGHPARVVKEAIVSAVIHRDYRLNRDIFDARIEVESPGLFPGTITRAGSKARNPLIAVNLGELPDPSTKPSAVDQPVSLLSPLEDNNGDGG
jgi:hypothetical protein